jgi:hypothetical protein
LGELGTLLAILVLVRGEYTFSGQNLFINLSGIIANFIYQAAMNGQPFISPGITFSELWFDHR